MAQLVEHHLAKVRVAGSNPVVRSRGGVGLLTRVLSVVAIVALAGCVDPEAAEPVVYVAAASDTRDAFTELAANLEQSDGVAVEFVFGSSGMLREQVLNGAPYDVYVSADTAFVDEIVAAGFADPANVSQYATGVLAMIARDGVTLPDSPAALATDDAGGRIAADDAGGRIAIANPAHAPYGVAAREALESLGIYDEVANQLILAENVADAVRIVDAGEADFGLVALALVRQRAHVVVDAALHEPIRQTAAITMRGETNADARRFFELLLSPEGAGVLRKYGFVVENAP